MQKTNECGGECRRPQHLALILQILPARRASNDWPIQPPCHALASDLANRGRVYMHHSFRRLLCDVRCVSRDALSMKIFGSRTGTVNYSLCIPSHAIRQQMSLHQYCISRRAIKYPLRSTQQYRRACSDLPSRPRAAHTRPVA